jgi:outer membrane protein OmpA-like peptidoglycan-associated protein
MRTIPVASGLILLAAAIVPAAAQTVVGGLHQPEVTVDLSVLDALGPAPTLPDLLRGQTAQRRGAHATHPAPAKGIALHPPRAKKKKAVAEATPKGEQTTAARPAAPIAPVAATGGAVPRESVAATPLAEPAPNPPAPAATPAAAPAAAPPAKPAAPEATPPAAAASAPAAPPVAPTAAPPSPVPATTPPAPATVTAMSTPPSLPPASPVTPTPAAAPAAVAAAGEHTRILFAGGATDLPDDAKARLDALARLLATDGHLRLQLAAYAGGSSDQASQARRISLQRAIAVRSYLMEHGVANTRMDVRALGNRAEGNDPPDRVDIIMLEH